MGLIERLKNYIGDAGHAILPGGRFTVPDSRSDPDDGLSAKARRSLSNAHKNPVIFSLVTWLSNQASGTPMVMQQSAPDGLVKLLTVHPLLDKLHKPSEFLGGQELLSVSLWDMLLRGQAMWAKERLNNGRVDTLKYLSARRTEVKGTEDELVTSYLYRPRDGTAPVVYDPGDIVHIRLTPDPMDPKNGLAPLVALERTLLVAEQTGDYTSTFLNEVGAAGGFLMPVGEKVLDPEVAKETRKYIHNEFRGSKRGALGVLRVALNFVRTTIDPKSVGTREIFDEMVELICAAFQVHPAIVGLGAGNSQSRVGTALKELERAAWTNRVIPVQDTIAEQIGLQLLPEFVPPDELKQWKLTWDRSGVLSLQPDLLREAQRWAVLVRTGIATRYDARRAQNLETDDEDKVYLLPSNIAPTPPGALPAPPEPSGGDGEGGSESDTPAGTEEAQERSWVSKAYIRQHLTKASLNDEQRALLLAFARDAQALEAEFTDELEEAFEDLGERAEEAFLAVSGVEFALNRNSESQLKQEGDELADEVAEEVNRIMRSLNVTVWAQAALIPAWDGHTIRTLNFTVGSVNGTMGLGVNIPNHVVRDLLDKGGTRRGLIDFTKQTRDAMFRTLVEGRGNGEHPLQLARRIRQDIPAGPFPQAGAKYRAQLIARTETAYSQVVSALEVYKEAGDFDGLQVTDGDYDEACAAMDGQVFSFADFEAIEPLEHPNCTRAIAPVRRS